MLAKEFDFEKYRLRRFMQRLGDIGELEVHDEPVPLIQLSSIIERTSRAVLFRQAGPDKLELLAKAAAGRSRLIAALDCSPGDVHETLLTRIATPQTSVEVPSDEAPVHAVKLTGADVDLLRLPFHPQHEYDGSSYISSGIDYVIDPVSGRTNVGSRRLSLRNRFQAGTNITAPSDLKRIYEGCAKRRERLPISFTIGSHPLDFLAATTRLQGDEHHMVSRLRGEAAPFVRCLTNNILVPADAEIVIEGYLDERGYCEPEGPFGEYMGYYGAIHMDPVFTCTAITMRTDVLHQTLQHGSAFVLDETDAGCMTQLRIEATAMRHLKTACQEVVAVSSRSLSGGAGTLRVSMRQHRHGEARHAIHTIFGMMPLIKHVFVFDEDIDPDNDRQVEWALGTRFQADQDLVLISGMMGRPMDPSLNGRRLGSKAGFDCTLPFGRERDIVMTRCAAKSFAPPSQKRAVEDILAEGPRFFTHLVEAAGSEDGREIAAKLDELRVAGRLGRDRDGRYHLVEGKPGTTAIVGSLYRDPNEGI
jgi:UbiD family decarboxylase